MTNQSVMLFNKVFKALSLMLSCLTLITMLGCKTEDDVVINVDLKNPKSYMEGKKVFLGEEATKKFLDSAIVKYGKFQLRVKANADFIPFEASMRYATGDQSHPFWPLGYKNLYRDKTFMSQFYADRGVMNLVIDTSSTFRKKEVFDLKFLNINEQTEAAYKFWGFKPAVGSSQKSSNYNVSAIKKFPASMHLLRQIDWNKSELKDQELTKILSLFDKSVYNTPIYKQLVAYAKYENQHASDIPLDVSLFRPDFSITKLAVDPNKHNLVVFWASWCGPCRQEIPQISKLLDAHRDNLNVMSISIDQNEKAWQTAMKQEKMPWAQMLLRRDSSFVKFNKKYNLNAIPVWLLFNPKGKLIAQQVGLRMGKDAIDNQVASLLATR